MGKKIIAMFFAVLMIASLCTGALASEEASEEAVLPEDAGELILSAISCKDFSDEEIPEELVEDIIQAGIQSPSAMNSQPWQFIIVEDETLKESLVSGAPLVVIISVPIEDFCLGGNSQFAAGTAAEAMYLYAQAEGLGAHMYAAPIDMVIYADEDSPATYGIEDGYEAAVVMAFGYYTDYTDSVSGATERNDYDSFVKVLG